MNRKNACEGRPRRGALAKKHARYGVFMASSKKILISTPAMNEMLAKTSLPGCKKQAFLFANIVRKNLLQAGLDEGKIKEALEKSFEAFAPNLRGLNEECMLMVRETFDNFINSDDLGRDLVGRALRRYCFDAVRREESEGRKERTSDENATTKEEIPGGLTERLIELFLISVRGSVEGVDPIMSLPVLFGTDLASIDQISRDLGEIVPDYKMGEEEGAPVYWNGFFLDNRTQAVTLDLIGAVLAKMQEAGAENVLLILENLYAKYQRRYGTAYMERSPGLDHVYALMGMLESAAENIAEALASARPDIPSKP